MDNFIREYTNNNIERIVNEKYDYYKKEIRTKNFSLNSQKIGWKSYPLIDNKDGTYFHLITKDYQNKDGFCCPNRLIKCDNNFVYNPMMSDEFPPNKKRTLCGHRIQCLPVIPKIFSNSKNCLIWEKSESTPKGKRVRIKILDKQNKYFIVLDKRKNGSIYYWTSYPVNDKKITKFEKEYMQYNTDQKNYSLSHE